jgi:prepilin-type N-terminal cleavage/methylation domain-containing protein
MKLLSRKKSDSGFTIIELLVATAVFSLVLIVFLSAIIRISELFYKGVNMSNTQEAARNIVQDISDDIQFYQQQPVIGANYFCVGAHRYTYSLYTKVDRATSHGITREVINGGCPSPSTQPVNYSKGEELVDTGMQLNKLTLSNCANGLCTISIHLIYYGADPSVLVPGPSGVTPAVQAPDATCGGPASSSEFCAVADYQSTVLQNF